MKQRLLIILLALLTTMTAGAQNSSGTFSSGVTWNFDTGTKTLTFTGSGVIPDKPNYGSVPWEKTNVEHLVFGSGITRIGNQVFYDHVHLKDVVFQTGSQLTEIGSKAFNSCTSLSAITLPEHLTSIGNYAFEYCRSLESVSIPANVTSIGNSAFNSCTGLTSVTILSSVETIGNGAFLDCTGLTSVTIFAPSLTNYEGLVFAGNAEGRKIYVPSGSVDIYKAGWSDYASAIEPLDYIIDVGSATGIKEVKSEKYGVEGWFSLDGRRLSGKPTAKGIYIHEGKKVVVK